jgi:hypothetical protein
LLLFAPRPTTEPAPSTTALRDRFLADHHRLDALLTKLWFATEGMQRDTSAPGNAPGFSAQPSIAPVAGGGVLGVAGAM